MVSRRQAYALVCTRCRHLASRHGLVPGAGSLSEGPYRCAHIDCGCEISQAAPLAGINKAQFDATFADRRDPRPAP